METKIIKQYEAKRGSSKSDAQDKAINLLRLRTDLQKAIESENYVVAAGLRDEISKFEVEYLASSATDLAYQNVQYAFRLGQKLFVVTCSPARDSGADYIAWGHSTLVGPFGEVIATTEHEEAIIVEEIDLSLIELKRSNLPLETQRRGDLYQLVDVQRLNSW